jgi:hypothetical protein
MISARPFLQIVRAAGSVGRAERSEGIGAQPPPENLLPTPYSFVQKE